MPVLDWVKQFTESVIGGPPFEIGDVVTHPDGRQIAIVGGQFWGLHGLSNYWSWQEVRPDGSLAKRIESGYGWRTAKSDETIRADDLVVPS